MKTVTIVIYPMFGTWGYCAEVRYRGRVLRSFQGRRPDDVGLSAWAFAKGAGFTGRKYMLHAS